METRDRNSEITILGSEIYARYKGDFKTSRFIEIANKCQGLRGDGPVLLQTSKGQSSAKCFRIVERQNRLDLVPVRGGETLRYRRP